MVCDVLSLCYNLNTSIIESNQVWASKKNHNVQRIILQADTEQKRVFYVEYWKDEDQMHKEGTCSTNQLKSWGSMVKEMVHKGLLNRSFEFLNQDRFSRSQLMLADLASVIINPENRQEVLSMIYRIKQMGSGC